MSHYYHDPESGHYFPSVTTILSATLPEPESLIIWKKKYSDWKDRTARAQRHGTLIHFSILNKLSGGTLDLDDLPPMWQWYPDTVSKIEIANMMWKEMLKREKLTLGFPRLIEHKIINREEKYAGKFDLLCPINDVLTLLDIKTSARVYDTHLLQLGGYYAGIPESERPKQAGVITLNVDPERNPKLTGKIHIYSEQKVQLLASEFLELARRFHREGLKPRDDN